MLWDKYAKTMAGVLDQVCERSPEKEAVIFNDEQLSWAQLNEHATRIACHLASIGITRGDRVGIMCTVRPEYVAIYLACAKLGAILVGFNAAYKAAEVDKLVARTQPKAFFILRQDRDRQLLDEIAPVLETQETPCAVLPIEAGEQIATGWLAQVVQNEPQAQWREAVLAAQQQVQPDDGFLIVFTSGSTGVPKAAVLTHRNVIANLAVLVHNFQMSESDRAMVHLPLNHVGGANNQLAAMILSGSTAVMIERFHPKTALEMIQKHRITYVMQVPTMFIMMLGVENFKDYDLSSLRACCVAGAVTPPHIMRQMQEMAPLVMTGYGMTEVGGFATYTQADDDSDTISFTVGRIAPEYRMKVVDDARKEVGVNEVGEVAFSGASVFKGYFGDPAATDEALSEGWYYTGDLGRVDERGYLTLVDRKKNMFITGGYNVYPLEIEGVVADMDGVDMCACVARKDPTFGEIGVLYVASKNPDALTVAAVHAYCRERLADYKVPRYIGLCEALPLTPLGKIDKQTLVARAAGLEGLQKV